MQKVPTMRHFSIGINRPAIEAFDTDQVKEVKNAGNSTQFSFNIQSSVGGDNNGGIVVIDETKLIIKDRSARSRPKYGRPAPIISGSPLTQNALKLPTVNFSDNVQ